MNDPRIVHVDAQNRIQTIDNEVATLGRQPPRRGGSTMSATPRIAVPHDLEAPLPMTLPRLAEKKRLGEPIVMVTAYDYPVGAGRRRPPASTSCSSATRAR